MPLSYPPSPWTLNATAYVSLWRLPAKDWPIALGTGIRELTLFGSVMLCSGFVEYGPGGDLQYRELFLAVLARAGARLGASLPLIWVDSVPSLEGGRALWAIPKHLATVHVDDRTLHAAANDRPIASMSFEPGRRLLRRFPIRATVVQARGSEVLRTPIHVSAEVERIGARWYIPQDSPLSVLQRRVPIMSLRLSQARLRFGA
jgi:Acetoacetate decarboxylase (ADC)